MKKLVGGDCYHTILIFDIKFDFVPIIGAMVIAPYKYENLTYLSQKIFLNVKIT